MSDQTIRDALNQVVARVFEQTAFMFPETTDLLNGIPCSEGDLTCVSLKFSGERSGDIALILPAALCHELAANILGEELTEEDTREKELDAARETLNIIAGQFLIQMFGTKALFNLSAPETSPLTRDDFFSAIGDKEYTCCMVDHHPVITAVSIRTEAYEHTSTGC